MNLMMMWGALWWLCKGSWERSTLPAIAYDGRSMRKASSLQCDTCTLYVIYVALVLSQWRLKTLFRPWKRQSLLIFLSWVRSASDAVVRAQTEYLQRWITALPWSNVHGTVLLPWRCKGIRLAGLIKAAVGPHQSCRHRGNKHKCYSCDVTYFCMTVWNLNCMRSPQCLALTRQTKGNPKYHRSTMYKDLSKDKSFRLKW